MNYHEGISIDGAFPLSGVGGCGCGGVGIVGLGVDGVGRGLVGL